MKGNFKDVICIIFWFLPQLYLGFYVRLATLKVKLPFEKNCTCHLNDNLPSGDCILFICKLSCAMIGRALQCLVLKA